MPETLVMIVEEMKKSRALYSQILALQSGCGYSLQAQSQAAPLPVSRYCCHTHSCLCPLIAAEPELTKPGYGEGDKVCIRVARRWGNGGGNQKGMVRIVFNYVIR